MNKEQFKNLENKRIVIKSSFPKDGIKLCDIINIKDLDINMTSENIIQYLDELDILKSICENYVEFYII